MKKPYRSSDPIRRAQPAAGQPLGWLPTLKAQVETLRKQLSGIELRLDRKLVKGEPAAAVGERIFSPQPTSFQFDILQTNGGAFGSFVDSQFVMQDGITYEIPILFPPPGVFRARYLKVNLYQRVFTPAGPFQCPMGYADYFAQRPTPDAPIFANNFAFQTLKYSYPYESGISPFFDLGGTLGRSISFLWNLIDTKSGNQFADELVPDLLLLPQSSAGNGTTGYMLEFTTPWLFERDAQLTFLFRPITPVIQPSATSGFFPFPFDDLEQGGTVRNMAVTVRAEVHGTRYVDSQDALRLGARIGDEGDDQ